MHEEELIAAARAAREYAYAPYSGFKVGAALLAGTGNVYTGCNIENASYGATICAERVAIAKAVSAGDRTFTALAVVADGPEPVAPCGFCRQFLAEFGLETIVHMANLHGDVSRWKLRELLPVAFTSQELPKKEA
ncbi:MAG: cytidine deaminase [Bacteroidota bacterium]